jgi:hypothetical protein
MTENAATVTDCYTYGGENIFTTARRERRDSRIQDAANSSLRRSVASWLLRQFGPPPPPPRCYFSRRAYFTPQVARARANAVLDRREP